MQAPLAALTGEALLAATTHSGAAVLPSAFRSRSRPKRSPAAVSHLMGLASHEPFTVAKGARVRRPRPGVRAIQQRGHGHLRLAVTTPGHWRFLGRAPLAGSIRTSNGRQRIKCRFPGRTADPRRSGSSLKIRERRSRKFSLNRNSSSNATIASWYLWSGVFDPGAVALPSRYESRIFGPCVTARLLGAKPFLCVRKLSTP